MKTPAKEVYKDKGRTPKKRYFRARAHSNPLNDQLLLVPSNPEDVDWSLHYTYQGKDEDNQCVRFVDVGCGFGGLLVRLSALYPQKCMLGLEIRDKVAHYVRKRIDALRTEHPGHYGNISVIRTNSQKFLVNYIKRGQLTKLFFLFPDPHFKATNYRRRIIQTALLTEYAYCLCVGGMLYALTDVPELAKWMKTKLDAHPMFAVISDTELRTDTAAQILASATEEGKKVEKNNGETWRLVYRRVSDGQGSS